MKFIQQKDNWYIVNPALIIQRPSYSHILNKNVNYIQYFNTNERPNMLINKLFSRRK